MTQPARSATTVSEAVTPLELFFDLIFAFAISQLADHLLTHLTWRGAAETAVMLIAVFGVWSYVSFEATMLHVSRALTQRLILSAAVVGLFMNAAIATAFGGGRWEFVGPLLVIQAGGAAAMLLTARTHLLREHAGRMLIWISASAALWIVGGFAGEQPRLLLWAGAASIDVIGTWLAHPVPGRVLRSENVPFDADHMIERCRLFLLIALGEAVLTTGAAIAGAPRNLLTFVSGICALVAILALWAIYFGDSDRILDQIIETTSNPIYVARMGANGLLVAVMGLIALAAANELVIDHPRGDGSITIALLLFGGPLLCLLSQKYFLRRVADIPSFLHRPGFAAVILGGGLALFLPRFISLGLLALLLSLIVTGARRHR